MISLLFAFVALLLFTMNPLISLYAIISIGAIEASIVSVMNICGYSLGISESIGIVILIGLSVDYCVHLASHYVDSVYHDRYSKTKDAFT